MVNVLTFANSLLTGFQLGIFPVRPADLPALVLDRCRASFWGRGPFCGSALSVRRAAGIAQQHRAGGEDPATPIAMGSSRWLWPLKYIIFLGLFGMSLYPTAFAEQPAEVEPFKTAIVLKFARMALRHLCADGAVGRTLRRAFFLPLAHVPMLGAALAIPGRVRGSSGRAAGRNAARRQRCAKERPVQAIHPEGHINVTECIYRPHCQELYFDDHRCLHMIQVRLKREKGEALMFPDSGGGKARARSSPPAASQLVCRAPKPSPHHQPDSPGGYYERQRKWKVRQPTHLA